MKRLVCLILCGLLLLAGCQKPATEPAVTPTTASTTAVTTATTDETTTPTTIATQPPTTTTTLSREQELEQFYSDRIDEFLQAWKAEDVEAMRYCTGSEEIATLLAEGVTVESYRVGPLTADNPRRLTLSVSKSSVPSIPEGESEWWIRGTDDYDGLYLEFCPIDEDYTARWANLGISKDLPVWFCGVMATELNLFDTVADFSRLSPAELGAKGGTLMRLHNAWLKATEENPHLPDQLTEPELSWFTEQILGVNVTDFSASPSHIPATETEVAKVGLGAYGGRWHYAGLVDHTEQDGVHTVTIRYFADITRLVEAVTVRYTAQQLGNGVFRLLSCQRLSGGTYPPVVGTT